ncbi:MAG: helix-hairpin-helix domain-containing protein [Halanaerobacter sp.]
MKNINSANVEELQEIKGVGKVTAQKIVQYREEVGGFETLEEVKNVSGIGAKNFANLEEELTIDEDSEIENKEDDLIKIEFNQAKYGIEEVDEVHLVGDMNDWDPTDKTYALEEVESGVWANSFDLEEGLEYKIMYDSTDWNEDKHVGFYGGNLKVTK